jgi:hypothetical protein
MHRIDSQSGLPHATQISGKPWAKDVFVVTWQAETLFSAL